MCFGPHHSQNAMLNLQKIHDVAFRATQSMMSASQVNERHSRLGNHLTPKSGIEQSSLFRKSNTNTH